MAVDDCTMTPAAGDTETSTGSGNEAISGSEYVCSALDALYGEGSEKKLRGSKVLVVGAGGVGCELLKNLVSISVGDITVVDLDIIDFSNLNRQFLFRRCHVSKPKATIACTSVQSMYPSTERTYLSINGHLNNIKDVQYDLRFFQSFDLVCNALDNLEARRHVNRMCLAADVPMIDSGSTGYSGQCEIYGAGFECYDCIGRPSQKSYAVCTIRSTPEKPVHCIVWAKFLFDLIFGPPNSDNVLNDLDQPSNSNPTPAPATNGNAASTAAVVAAAVATNPNADAVSTVASAVVASHNGTKGFTKQGNGNVESNGHVDGDDDQTESDTNGVQVVVKQDDEKDDDDEAATSEKIKEKEKEKEKEKKKSLRFCAGDDDVWTFIKRLSTRIFVEDVEKQRKMESLWKTRPAPTVQDVYKLTGLNMERIQNIDDIDIHRQTAWTAEYSAAVFIVVLRHIVEKRSSQVGSMKFDKDDRDALLFVAACSNLRSEAYGVPLQSPFHVKGIAGNIVHAVATTNAMVAGLVCMEVIKILTTEGKKLNASIGRKTFVGQTVLGSRVKVMLTNDPLRKANPSCYVCSAGHVLVELNCTDMHLRSFISGVCKKHLGFNDPIISVVCGDQQATIYECGVGLEDDEIEHYETLALKLLTDVNIQHGSQVVVEDLMQNLKITMHVSHVDNETQMHLKEEERFQIVGQVPAKKEEEECKKKKVEDSEDAEAITWVDKAEASPDWGMLEAKQTQIKGGKKRTLDETKQKEERDTKKLKDK